MPTTPLFAHVVAMTDDIGIFEHALLTVPRPEHGYCVDDVARALVAASRQDPHGAGASAELGSEVLTGLSWVYLAYLERAQTPDGLVVNRPDHADAATPRVDGHAVDAADACDAAGCADDCWGRALWAFGTAASRSRDADLARRAAACFATGAQQRSGWRRAMAFAGLGAAELLRVDSDNEPARRLLADAAAVVGGLRAGEAWPWPEPRLTYANAVFPDVLLAAGDSLHDPGLIADGLAMLGWLLDLQHTGSHLSPTPASGWGAGEPLPAFDQQPIEAATLADACARAFELTGDPRWSQAVELSAAWFLGHNDVGIPLYDRDSGGCCDGLEPAGRNENQGAESTLAFVTTMQHARRLAAGVLS